MNPDFLVVGAGVAGLRAAIELASAGRVLVVAKDSLRESSSEYAQGGIAAALNDDDEVSLHERDTIAAGDGLCDPAAVRTLVEEAPAAIGTLIGWGAEFDREGAKLLFAREGAHSRSRVLHAHGDSTGREIVRTLYRKASSLPNIEFRGFASMTGLIPGEDGGVAGVSILEESSGETVLINARAVLLATGGLGRVFKETTNPDVATGDGVALAYLAGAEIRDIEFVQFHPTALFVDGAPRFLLSEALRGEGAYLRNASGERFMDRYHPLGELAPRDAVSRSIVMEILRTASECVYLDLTHLDAAHIRERFPRIYETCLHFGIDLAAQPAPVHPAAHYSMGGVCAGLDGQTSLTRLFAAGEVASIGVHGANRLASNSLLEGVVFGARAGRTMREIQTESRPAPLPPPRFPLIEEAELRRIAWEKCGVLRDAEGLSGACERLAGLSFEAKLNPERRDFEIRAMHSVALLAARCALARRESRGAHYRLDFPQPEARFAKHSSLRSGQDVHFV